MALVDDSEVATLRKLFAGMDVGDEAGAISAMTETTIFMRQHDLSFRQIVQEIEQYGLLLPSKIGVAIQLMDSTTLSEAEGALAGARRLMRGCGLTFERIIEALEHEPTQEHECDQCEQLRRAYRFEVERSREMAAELQILRAGGAMPAFYPTRTPVKNFVLVSTLLCGLLLAMSIMSTITDLFRPANATATPRAPAVVQRDNVNPPPAQRPAAICWRDRSIHGACF
jgi:hypothetical protein